MNIAIRPCFFSTFDHMKLRILLLLFFPLFGLQSCQSEYSERMSEAIKLRNEYQKVREDMYQSNNAFLKVELSAIEKEIRFHAKLSGNETLFLKEVWNN